MKKSFEEIYQVRRPENIPHIPEDNQRKLESMSKKKTKNPLLESPELVSLEEERKQKGEMSFSFSSDTRRYYLGHKDGKPFFMVEYFDSLPNELSEEEKEKFTKEIRKQGETEKTVYVLKYGEVPEPKGDIKEPKKYRVAQSRDFEIREQTLPKPQEMEMAQLVEILKDKKVLFYTGAGISIASGVHSMDQLQETLGIEMSKNTDGFLKKAIANPQDVIDSWEEFTKAAFEKPATPAHLSLSRLAQKLKSQILTENVDRLQERAGVKAIHLASSWLKVKENIQPKWLKDIHVVITIGLSYDDRGFLGWYKENNPDGKIVAVNLNQPSYLGSEDFMLKGDCQKVIPELEKQFTAKKNF